MHSDSQMDPPLRTSIASNQRVLNSGQSTIRHLELREVMIECVEMREESSNSFTAMEESEEPSTLRQDKSSLLISLD
jgi:hypothetical protein